MSSFTRSEKEEASRVLLEYLKVPGNARAFRLLRGRMQKFSEFDYFQFIEDFQDSKSQFVKQHEPFFIALPVMSKLLLQLRENGLNNAYDLLKEALQFPCVTICGEEGFWDTAPVTVLVLNPMETLPFAEWMYKKCNLSQFDHIFFNYLEDSGCCDNDRKFFSMIPSLRMPEGREAVMCYERPAEYCAQFFYKDLVFPFANAVARIPGEFIALPAPACTTGLSPIVYICKAPRNDVLGAFSRKQQEKISTWVVDIPEYYLSGSGYYDPKFQDSFYFPFHLHFTQNQDILKKACFTSRAESNDCSAVLISSTNNYRASQHYHFDLSYREWQSN